MEGSVVELSMIAALSLPMTLMVLVHLALSEGTKSLVKRVNKHRNQWK